MRISTPDQSNHERDDRCNQDEVARVVDSGDALLPVSSAIIVRIEEDSHEYKCQKGCRPVNQDKQRIISFELSVSQI